MNRDFDNLILKLSTDITNSLKTNLSVYVEKNEKNSDLLQNFKMLLFKLPEYCDLQNKYNNLLEQYKELEDKYHLLNNANENISLNVIECTTSNASNANECLNNVKVIELNYLKNNVINKSTPETLSTKQVKEEEEEVSEAKEDEEETEEEETDEEETEEEETEEEDEEETEEEEEVSEAKEEVSEAKEEEKETEEEVSEAKEDEDEEEVSEAKEDEEEVSEAKEDEEEEEEGEEEELVLITIEKKNYYINELNNSIYECLPDKDIGKCLGTLVNGKIRQ
jgi:hypothetical protein